MNLRGTYKVTTQPTAEALTLSEAKTHLKVDYSDDDTYITTLISVAREFAEHYTGRAIMEQTVKQYLEGFPAASFRNEYSAMVLFKPPLISITSVKYYDSDNVFQTLSSSKYVVDSIREPARIYLAPGETWPATKSRADAIEIEYQVGYTSAANVPTAIKQAMLLVIADLYERREDYVRQLPTAAEALLNFYSVTIF